MLFNFTTGLSLVGYFFLKRGESQAVLFFASFQRGNKRGNLKIDQGMLRGQLPSNLGRTAVTLTWVACILPGMSAKPLLLMEGAWTGTAGEGTHTGARKIRGYSLELPAVWSMEKPVAVPSKFLNYTRLAELPAYPLGLSKRNGGGRILGHQRPIRREIIS